MTFLPIADRELRVAARSKATHRWRIIFAVAAVVVGGAIALIAAVSRGALINQLGTWIFGTLKWAGYVFACAAGVFLTADSLSEEKREGTLGLLFLTDLRGHDVVLGKLLAVSLRSFYGLLAIFPVMAFSFVMGGVTSQEFWLSLVAMCNTLFFALALGMLISVLSRDPHKAMTGTLVAMAVFLFVMPSLDYWIPGAGGTRPRLALLCPAYSFVNADSSRGHEFWLSTLLVHLTGWAFLAVASRLVPLVWHDRAARDDNPTPAWLQRFEGGNASARGRALREENPICWIIARDRWGARLARVSVALILVVLLLSLLSLAADSATTTPPPTTPTTNPTTVSSPGGTYMVSVSTSTARTQTLFGVAQFCSSALSLALQFWLASQVIRFYVDGKKDGFLELLVVTPVRPADVVCGHWLALRRLFFVPVVALIFLRVVLAIIQWLENGGVLGMRGAGDIAQVFLLVLTQISWLTGLWAITWYAIWMGLASKKINLALMKTIFFVKIVPWFCIGLISGLSVFVLARIFQTGGFWLIAAVPQVMIIGINFGLVWNARRRVEGAFARWTVS